MRNRDFFGSAISSGAKRGMSALNCPITSTRGARTCVSYSSFRARNQSRSLFRFSARRNDSVLGVKGEDIFAS